LVETGNIHAGRDVYVMFARKQAHKYRIRLAPETTRSFECSLLAMIISGVIHDFPVADMTDAEILSNRSLLDLFRTVDSLIGRYEDVCKEIATLLDESDIQNHFYGSGYRVAPARLVSANRRLASISQDMREISSSLNTLLTKSSDLHQRLSALLQICVSISIAEDFLVLQLSAPTTVPTQPVWQGPRSGALSELPIDDNVLAPRYFGDLGEKMVADFTRVLGEIQRYRGELRRATANVTSANSVQNS